MDNKITDLEQLRIHELRDLARKMGVQAPTVLKKEEIIDEIMKIMNGEVEPFARHSKKGRPARNNSDSFDVVDFILPKPEELHEMDDNCEYNMAHDKFSYVLNMGAASYCDSNEPHSYSGLIEIKPEGYGVVHVEGICPSDRDVFVGKNIVKQLNLRSGEKVTCVAKLIKEGYPETAYEVKRVSPEKDVDFDSVKGVKLADGYNIHTDISNFKLGGRYFLKTTKDIYEVVPEIAKAVKEEIKDAEVVQFYLNAMIERIDYDDSMDIEFVPFNKMDEEIIIASEMFFEECKRKAEQGKNIVVVLSGLSQLAKACNAVFLKTNNYQEISPKTVFRIKNILANAKKVNDNTSISLICVDDLKVPRNIAEMFEFEILPLF